MPITASVRRVIEGRQTQGVLEDIFWEIDTLPWGGLPSLPDIYVWDVSQNYLDVTAVVAPGVPVIIGNIFITTSISGLTQDHLYRVECLFTIGVNALSCFFEIQCER